MNQPDKAEAAYQRVMQTRESQDKQTLAFSAADLRAFMLMRIGRKDEAANIARKIFSDNPRIASPGVTEIIQQISVGKK